MYGGLAFLTGLLTGIGTDLVVAARPGAQTSRHLRHHADDIGGAASRLAEHARLAADMVFEQGTRLVS